MTWDLSAKSPHPCKDRKGGAPGIRERVDYKSALKSHSVPMGSDKRGGAG